MKHVGTNVEWELGMEIVGTLPQESLAEGLWPRTIEELLAFIGLSDKKEVDISSRINSLFGQIANVTDSLITATIENARLPSFRQLHGLSSTTMFVSCARNLTFFRSS